MKFANYFWTWKSILTLAIFLLLSNLGNAKSISHASSNLNHSLVNRSGVSHLRNVPTPPPMPIKVNVKKSAIPPAPAMKIKDPAVLHPVHNQHSNNHSLPTLDEINRHQGGDHKLSTPLSTPSLTQITPIKNSDLPTLAEINNHQAAVSGSAPLSKRTEENLLAQAKRPKYTYTSSSSGSSSGGFFQNTSNQNSSTARKALGGFILGFILFFISIQLICWNERRAVKFTNFIDWAEKEENLMYKGTDNLGNEKIENKAYIINGTLNVTKEPVVDCPEFEKITNKINSNSTGSKLLFIKFCYEKFTIVSQTDTGVVRVDENGNEQNQMQAEEDWVKVHEDAADKTSSKLHSGEGDLSGVYKFNLGRISSLCEKDTYTPALSDCKIIETWLSTKMNNPILRVVVRGDYFYIISNSYPSSVENFDPDTYDFKESDRRLSIKYLQVSEEKPRELTLAGKFVKEGDWISHSAFNSPIKQAEWNYFLCCCGETDEPYKVDIVNSGKITKKDIIENYELENKTCTCFLRIFGFLMHFGAYYLILYPLILLIGMIPFIGAVGATILIFFAFLFACITYLFIIAVAWIFARPLFALFIFAIIGALIYMSKVTKDKYGGNYPPQNDGNSNYDMNNTNTGNGKMKFL